MTAIIYSNCIAAYAFEDFKIKEKILFKDILKNNQLLKEGKFIEEEKKLIEKYKKEKTIFIGFKEEKIENIEIRQDNESYEKISNLIKNEKNIFPELKEINIQITKQQLKNSVKGDNLIMQTIYTIDELNKVANSMAKRLREWYELHNPEFSKKTEEHEKFTELILKKSKKELLQQIKIKPENSMGAELSKEDLDAILEIAKELSSVYKLREREEKYLEKLMQKHCPNINAVAGALIGAKLISISGDLKRLVEFPASTVQILGAEKALFRHMKTGAKPPKYGVIISHPLIANAKQKDKGKVARALADKIAIAAKIDYFKGDFIGDQLRKKLDCKFGK